MDTLTGSAASLCALALYGGMAYVNAVLNAGSTTKSWPLITRLKDTMVFRSLALILHITVKKGKEGDHGYLYVPRSGPLRSNMLCDDILVRAFFTGEAATTWICRINLQN